MITDCFDIQVNGYAGVDFNHDNLTTEDFENACREIKADGCTEFLPTIITDDISRMEARLRAIRSAIEQSSMIAEMVRGIHVEGPFLNAADGTAGAHPRQHICHADMDMMKRLLDASGHTIKLVTLAPECDSGHKVTRHLSNQGIVVSAGHCDPTIDELQAAIDQGLSMFTHVGNGCSLMQNRHDNVVQRVLSLADQLWCCWIADGIHIPAFALKNYLKTAGCQRSIIVTDAMTAAGLEPGQYTLGSQPVIVDESYRAMLPDSDGRLAGSVATAKWLQQVLANDVGLSEAEIRTMMCDNPRKAIANELAQDFRCD
ncbi:MAG: N-acetylglucosamine-6-phosphate deacetylase [Fuerstiella sp.]